MGCEAIQIFTKNSNQWQARPIPPQEARDFSAERRAHRIRIAFAHDSYLINLASPDPTLLEKSRAAFLDEVERAEQLGLDFVVLHPGAHLGDGEEKGIRRVTDSFKQVLKKTKGYSVKILIETTAGQGTSLGFRFEQIRAMLEGAGGDPRLGVCVDTCHLLGAGYDLRDRKGYEETFDAFERLIGISRIQAFHLNDSKKPLGSRVDRHEHIGEGCLGVETFRLILNDPRFENLPMVLETPKGKDDTFDRKNLSLLRSLIRHD